MDFQEDFAVKHGLKKDEDYWWHKQSGHWIIKHDAVVRLADQNNIVLEISEIIDNAPDRKAMVCRGLLKDACDEDVVLRDVQMTGECLVQKIGKNTIPWEYPWALAQKRGEDRCVLRLLAPGGGLYSDAEADAFKKGYKEPPPSQQKRKEERTEAAEGPGGYLSLVMPGEFVSKALDPTAPLKFGKHKGRTWQELLDDERGYLEWLAQAAYSEHGEGWKDWSYNALTALLLLQSGSGQESPEEDFTPEDVPF